MNYKIPKNRVTIFMVALFMITPFIALIIKTININSILGAYTDCKNCLVPIILHSDTLIFGILLLLFSCYFYLNKYNKNVTKILALILRIVTLLLVVLLVVDTYLSIILSNRLLFRLIPEYSNLKSIISIIKQLPITYIILTVSLLLVSLCWLIFPIKIKSKYIHVLLILAVSFIIIYSAPIKTDYLHKNLTNNIFYINRKDTTKVKYSKEFIKKYSKKEIPTSCETGLNTKPNIILMVVESLSMHHSNLFSGLNNWTPNLDRIAQENTYYSNFFANGYSSRLGRLSMLTGEYSIRLPNDEYDSFYSTKPITKILEESGYKTSILFGSSTQITTAKEYLPKLGFNYIEDSIGYYDTSKYNYKLIKKTYKAYKGKAKYAFQSVPDGVLLDRAFDYITNEKSPSFTTIITTSSHPPFVVPEKDKRVQGEEKSIKYTDDKIGIFYDNLKKINFFDNGILIIVSDHRIMQASSKNEFRKYGDTTMARIPAIVASNSSVIKKGLDNNMYQQSDIYSSIKHLTTKNYCSRKNDGNLITRKPSECIFYESSHYSGELKVVCDSESAMIKINGDKTKLIKGRLKKQESILEYINTYRVKNSIK